MSYNCKRVVLHLHHLAPPAVAPPTLHVDFHSPRTRDALSTRARWKRAWVRKCVRSLAPPSCSAVSLHLLAPFLRPPHPLPLAVHYILASIRRNEGFADRVRVWQNAVGTTPGALSFAATASTNAGNFAAKASERAGAYGVDFVGTIRLDDVLDEDVELMRIDVEGHDGQVLDGARRLVCEHVVRRIMLKIPGSRTARTATCMLCSSGSLMLDTMSRHRNRLTCCSR